MTFWRTVTDGIEVFVRVTPNAKTEEIGAPVTRDDGSTWLQVRVRAVPDKGRANKAVIALMAGALDVPKSAISIATGETSRQKVLHIEGSEKNLAERLKALTGD